MHSRHCHEQGDKGDRHAGVLKEEDQGKADRRGQKQGKTFRLFIVPEEPEDVERKEGAGNAHEGEQGGYQRDCRKRQSERAGKKGGNPDGGGVPDDTVEHGGKHHGEKSDTAEDPEKLFPLLSPDTRGAFPFLPGRDEHPFLFHAGTDGKPDQGDHQHQHAGKGEKGLPALLPGGEKRQKIGDERSEQGGGGQGSQNGFGGFFLGVLSYHGGDRTPHHGGGKTAHAPQHATKAADAEDGEEHDNAAAGGKTDKDHPFGWQKGADNAVNQLSEAVGQQKDAGHGAERCGGVRHGVEDLRHQGAEDVFSDMTSHIGKKAKTADDHTFFIFRPDNGRGGL